MKKIEFIERHWNNLEPMTLREFETDLDSLIASEIEAYEQEYLSKLDKRVNDAIERQVSLDKHINEVADSLKKY